ncbi:MAG: cupin domain-containing protein [Candidatus Thorarchaeota archaeon]|jgi:mannose-6-phosphate isomerase-like protein (cupin superfamily)
MNDGLVQDWSELLWEFTRPNITTNVLGSRLLPEGTAVQAVTLTRVEPKGEFSVHADDYAHVFLFFEGQGEGWLGDEVYAIRPKLIVRVPSGLPHGYKNTGRSDLTLLTINYSDSTRTNAH